MIFHKPTLLLAGMLLVISVGSAQASLIDRGNGLLYDTVLNLTWLQDANYAKTSGYDADGKMNWFSANNWANNLVYAGYSDWRLATNSPINGTNSAFNYNLAKDGSTDFGFNITSPYSELSYMYYVNLGLKGSFSPSGANQANYGIFGNGTNNGINNSSYGQNDVGLVRNLQAYTYWSRRDYAPIPGDAWIFDTTTGYQAETYKSDRFLYAWAVRPGDVPSVPVPGAFWLFGVGLLGLLRLKLR
jgi:hypothetical protein